MDLSSIPGLGSLSKIDVAGFLAKSSQFILWVVALVILIAIVYYFYQKKKYNELFTERIVFFEDIRGKAMPVGEDLAMFYTITGTNVQLLYCKKRNIYLPKGNRKMSKNEYWYCKHKGDEYLNFDLGSINASVGSAGIDFNRESDKLIHANVNRLLEAKYKDKSAKWWLEYKEVIGLVVMILVLTICMFLIFGKVADLIGSVNAYEKERDAKHLEHQAKDLEILNLIQQIKTGTGVIKVGGG